MSAEIRKKHIIKALEQTEQPISATRFANDLNVSRQVIVGDIALLRASGVNIIATPRGYLLAIENIPKYVVACTHSASQLRDELYAVVDCGCGFVDVTVEHAIYGQIVGNLHIFSRADADAFCEKMAQPNVAPLSSITNSVHFHTLSCPTDRHFEQAKIALHALGLLLEPNE